jgi:hypothetical protein
MPVPVGLMIDGAGGGAPTEKYKAELEGLP